VSGCIAILLVAGGRSTDIPVRHGIIPGIQHRPGAGADRNRAIAGAGSALHRTQRSAGALQPCNAPGSQRVL